MQTWFEKLKADFVLNFVKANRWKYLLDGLGKTLLITLVACLLGVVIGVVIAMVRSTYDKTAEGARKTFGRRMFGVLDGICRVYLTVLRGTPVVVQLMIIYFVIFASSDNGTMVAALAFGLNSGAYVAEIVRGGIMSIDNGQFEAGRSLGFNYVQTMRFIIIPQTIKNVRAGQRVHRAAEGDVGGGLCGRAGPDQGRRHHPQPHLFAVPAADRGGADLSGAGHVLLVAGEQTGEEAAQQ